MKKLVLSIAFLALPLAAFAMEEKQLSKEEAQELWWDTAMPLKKYGKDALPYKQYRENMLKAIRSGAQTVQHHYHNPLINAITNRDYELTKLLLEHGAAPTFRGMNMISGFDALRFELGSELVDNPASRKQLEDLLEKYRTEKRTPYSGGTGAYISDYELKQQYKQQEQPLPD